MVTFKEVYEKFEDKGYGYDLFLFLPLPPIFDPTFWQLQCKSREELYENFKANQATSYYQQELEYFNVWIDYQKHK
jgi:hypothetical protein